MIELGDRGDRIVVGVSGGKDSTATCLHLMEMGLGPDDYDRVFCDTGWELPEVYEYLRGPLTDAVGPIIELTPQVPELDERREAAARHFDQRLGFRSAMVRLILAKGMFPSRRIRFCTETLKAETSARFLRDMDCEPINAVGIRAEESRERSQMDEWEWSTLHDCWVWRPLLAWAFEDVRDIHQRHGLQPAGPYFAGATRVGCAPCIMARKGEIAWLAERYPERIAVIRDLERAVAWLAAERRAARGEALAIAPTWFHNPNPPRDPATRKVLRDAHGYTSMWPIDRVVEWAQGPRNQIELFAGRVEDHGCMRWGFCDTGHTLNEE